MDYEKLYKDAIEKAKNLENTTAEEDALIKYIFPELRESEDEKIRKWLIKEMHRFHDCAIKEMCQEDINKTEIALAWLEKQKELTAQIVPGYPGHYFYDGNKLHLCSSPAMEEKEKDEAQRQYNLGVQAGREEAMYELEKEQKPGITEDNPIDPFDTKLFQDGVKEGRRLEREDMLKEQRYIKTIPEQKVYDIMNKLAELAESEFIPYGSNEFEKIQEIIDDVNKLSGCSVESTNGKAMLHVAEKSYQIGLRDGKMERKPDKCIGCNNIKGCINCVDGYQWAHIYEEQKPVSREEILGQLLQSGLITMSDYSYLIDKQKPEGGDSEKPNNQWEWEDDVNLNAIIEALRWCDNEGMNPDDIDPDYLISWLKSIRPQPKQEWSEEDIYMINILENIVARYRPDEIFKIGNKQGVSAYKICSWLKSIRPQSHWKPSEEQMETLKSCFHINPATGEPHSPSLDEIYMLSSLYNDLKKLM